MFFSLSAGKDRGAYLPARMKGQGFEVPRNIDLVQGLKPLWEVVPADFLARKVSVSRLRMKVASSDGSYWMQPLQATQVVQPPRRRRKQAKAADRSSKLVENGSSSSGSDTHSAHRTVCCQTAIATGACLSYPLPTPLLRRQQPPNRPLQRLPQRMTVGLASRTGCQGRPPTLTPYGRTIILF